MAQGWTPSTKQASSAIDDIPVAVYSDDALKYDFRKNLEHEESVVVRFLSFAEGEWTPNIPMRTCVRKGTKKDGSVWETSYAQVADPGDPYNREILDDAGTPLSECKVTRVWRTIVLVLFKRNAKKQKTEDLWEARYIEYNSPIAQQIKDLKNNIDAGFAFDSIPDYNIAITCVPAKSDPKKKSFTLVPVQKSFDDEGRLVADPFFGTSLEEAFGSEYMDYLGGKVPEIIDHLFSMAEEEVKPENVMKQFLRYADNAKAPAKASTAPPAGRMPARRPGVAPTATAPAEEAEATAEETAEEAVETTTAAPARRMPVFPKRSA